MSDYEEKLAFLKYVFENVMAENCKLKEENEKLKAEIKMLKTDPGPSDTGSFADHEGFKK